MRVRQYWRRPKLTDTRPYTGPWPLPNCACFSINFWHALRMRTAQSLTGRLFNRWLRSSGLDARGVAIDHETHLRRNDHGLCPARHVERSQNLRDVILYGGLGNVELAADQLV